MKGTCPRCGPQALEIESQEAYLVGVPGLTSFLQTEKGYACPTCKQVISRNFQIVGVPASKPAKATHPTDKKEPVQSKMVNLYMMDRRGSAIQKFVSISYPSVFKAGDKFRFPEFEGRIQTGNSIGRFGDPDLMAKFAEEYLKCFHSIMPKDRFPGTIVEIMPALLILFTSAELALKASLIRSNAPSKIRRSHVLNELYKGLEQNHIEEIERRFINSEINTPLNNLGHPTPAIDKILGLYSNSYGGNGGIYEDSRYFPEPTTDLPPDSGLRGSNLIKGLTPYPVFLPYVARAIIDTYWFFSGPERLWRLGAEISQGSKEPGNDNHGDWGLAPNSIGLVAIAVDQANGKRQSKENPAFTLFKKTHPTETVFDFMYGGNTLLFYLAEEGKFSDGITKIDGLSCQIWSKKRVGLHARDTYSLANTLANQSLNQWTD